MSDHAHTDPRVRIPLPFETVVDYVNQVDLPRLEGLVRLATDALARRRRERTPTAGETSAKTHGPCDEPRRWLLGSMEAQEEIARGARALLRQMGIEHLEPVGPQKLREMMRADGVREEENLFSRGIIEMREE